jgi:ABC-2 type transport system ATP-binding protein
VDAIVVDALVKDYGKRRHPKRALDSVSLRVPQGSAFGLIGPNGAGKTTLLKTLLGVVAPSAGAVQVLGGSPADLGVRRRIGYLPERLQLPTAWTALGFLHSVARLKHASRADAEQQLQRVGLGNEGHARIATFSKGMRQRLGLGAALIGAPELLVLDEPTDGIDPKGRADVRSILAQERARGATLFLNSHLLSETERICDQVGILVSGRLLRSGATLELCGNPSSWRVRFESGSDTKQLQLLGFAPTALTQVFACTDCDVAELNARLARAREQGALVSELVPEMRDLEAVLLELMGPADA